MPIKPQPLEPFDFDYESEGPKGKERPKSVGGEWLDKHHTHIQIITAFWVSLGPFEFECEAHTYTDSNG